ncbi:MAG: rhodanese-related sulfurtransferase [Dorea sp.]|jgi:hypothetical protein|nr:rhodanese-related sulfurtransferase [Dorea sp.]
MELLKWLQDWCKKQYENELGHIPEIKIYNIDNPGWVVKIDLSKTKFADKPFEQIRYDEGDNDWMFCNIKDSVFDGCGASQKLADILRVFKSWVSESRE